MSQIDQIPSKEELKTASQEVVNRYYQEYMRRWKAKNKDKVNAYARESYKRKKNKGNTKNNPSRFTKNDKQDNQDNTNTIEHIFGNTNLVNTNNQKEVTK